jgi:acyl-CoA synthetase (AMP-forming)/AMP-acid ligase II
VLCGPISLFWYPVDNLSPSKKSSSFEFPPPHPDTIAFLQYTSSGSTANAKGVMITHQNFEHQFQMCATDVLCTPKSRGVFWVPHVHDFGTICCILNAFANGVSQYILSPLSFLKHPAIWLDMIHKLRATHTCAPNFAFDLIVPKDNRSAESKVGFVVLGSGDELSRACPCPYS